MPSYRVIRVLEQRIEWREKTTAIRCNNGSEFISKEFIDWAKPHEIKIDYIQPDKPAQNTYIERHNQTMRYTKVCKYLFDSIEQVQEHATNWLWFYNNERPHTANNVRPPLMAA